MSTFVKMTADTPPEHSANMMQEMVEKSFWDEVMYELTVICLFCLGFATFRYMSTNAHRFPWLFQKKGKKVPPVPKMKGMTKRVPEPSTTPPKDSNTTAATASRPKEGIATNEHDTYMAHVKRVRSAIDKHKMRDTLNSLAAMHHAGHALPGFFLVSLFRLAKDEEAMSNPTEVLQKLPRGTLTPESVSALSEHAAKTADIALLREVQSLVIESDLLLPPAAVESLLRGYAASGDGTGAEAFDALLAHQGGLRKDSEKASESNIQTSKTGPPIGSDPRSSCVSNTSSIQVSAGDLSQNSLVSIVAACAESRCIRLAERLVAHSREQYGCVTLPLYSALLKVYCSAKAWQEAYCVYENMCRDGVKPDTVVYGSLIKAAVEGGMPELAKKLFQESGNPDILNYMSLIRSAGREQNVPKALGLLKELEISPLQADVAAYNCALEACVVGNDHKAAEELLSSMEKRGIIDTVSYNTYLKVLLAKGDSHEVPKFLKRMDAAKVAPNAVTYNSMVKEAVSRGDSLKAWKLTDDMIRMKISPDAFTCSILMKGIKHAPSAEGIDRILSLIQRSDVVLDEVLMNCILDACVRLKDAGRIEKVLHMTKVGSSVPSPHAYATLIRAYGHASKPRKAWELWQELRSVQNSTKTDFVNEEAFAAIIDACLASSDMDGAIAAFREVSGSLSQMPRAPSLFAQVAKACGRTKQTNLIFDLYKATKGLIALNKVTFNTLIDAAVRVGNMKQAESLFRDMTLENVLPDLITYSTIIKGHCASGDLESALTLLGQMQRMKIAPDAILFNSILDGCAHKQFRGLTEQVLSDMEAAGIAPSTFTLSILVKLYGRCRDLEAAIKVTEVYPKKYGFSLNPQVYTCLMSACIACGELQKAMDVYDRMVASNSKADAKTFETLLHGCLRYGEPEAAARLVGDMLANHQTASTMRSNSELVESIFVMMQRRDHANLVNELISKMKAAGIRPSARMVNASGTPMQQGPPNSSRLDLNREMSASTTSSGSGGSTPPQRLLRNRQKSSTQMSQTSIASTTAS
eukprot:TRINITY_DN14540_c0_g1_i1.p1 TRINITY_DN14540_c0_g1~~TRINITY_DN14540_c0_g1_i1.p1  ORF type:complete len:1035 (+),score=180.79 TRINITY_DN14540_c0_g1_i1:287-3391(+)